MALESRLYEQLDNSLQLLPKPPERFVLAFSGGIDSCVLLHLLSQKKQKIEILVWHVNHGLLDCADDMESFCEHKASQYNFDFKTSRLNLDSNQSNLEAVARKARYQLFGGGLSGRDVLLTAHHADDQAETFFLNLLRGSGSAGLRGIAAFKWLSETPILRPLLAISRGELEQYADDCQLSWFDDPSNQSDRFNRNYLRNRVMPVIKDRWPEYLKSIASVCAIQSETQVLLDELAADDFQQCQQCTGFHDISLNRRRLETLSISRQKNLIRFWLREQGRESLPQRKLEELVRQLTVSQGTNPVVTSKNYSIRGYQDGLYIVPHNTLVTINSEFDVDREQGLRIEPLNLDLDRQIILCHFEKEDGGQSVVIKFRECLTDGKNIRHRLKHLFQQHRVPPWLRPQIPLVYVNNEFVGIWLKHET